MYFWGVTWGAPTHVLAHKSQKLESCTKICMFMGYSKGTRGGIFYNPKEKKVMVSTYATFLEDEDIGNPPEPQNLDPLVHI